MFVCEVWVLFQPHRWESGDKCEPFLSRSHLSCGYYEWGKQDKTFIFPAKHRAYGPPETYGNECVITLNMEMNLGIVVALLCRSQLGSNPETRPVKIPVNEQQPIFCACSLMLCSLPVCVCVSLALSLSLFLCDA